MNGKIIYQPRYTQALLLDGAHYLSLDDAGFNPGTGHFAFDWLGQIDADTPDTQITLCRKGAAAVSASWAALGGWYFGADKTNLRLRLSLNDGNAGGQVTVYSSNNVFTLGSRFWAAVRADRAGQARFYVNGVDVGGGAVSTRAGSLDNTALLKIGGFDVATERLKGDLDFFRADFGRLLPAAWYAAEWDKLRFGMKRPETAAEFDGLEYWGFQGGLLGLAATARTLSYNGGGLPAYADGWPYNQGAIAAPFLVNCAWGAVRSRADTRDISYALNGSARTYEAAPKKGKWLLSFRNVPAAQRAALEGALDAGEPVQFFKDADWPRDFWGLILTPPEYQGEITGDTYELEVQEI